MTRIFREDSEELFGEKWSIEDSEGKETFRLSVGSLPEEDLVVLQHWYTREWIEAYIEQYPQGYIKREAGLEKVAETWDLFCEELQINNVPGTEQGEREEVSPNIEGCKKGALIAWVASALARDIRGIKVGQVAKVDVDNDVVTINKITKGKEGDAKFYQVWTDTDNVPFQAGISLFPTIEGSTIEQEELVNATEYLKQNPDCFIEEDQGVEGLDKLFEMERALGKNSSKEKVTSTRQAREY